MPGLPGGNYLKRVKRCGLVSLSLSPTVVKELSSQLLLQHHACLSAAMFPTVMVKPNKLFVLNIAVVMACHYGKRNVTETVSGLCSGLQRRGDNENKHRSSSSIGAGMALAWRWHAKQSSTLSLWGN